MSFLGAVYRHSVRWRWAYALLASAIIFTQSSFPIRVPGRIPHLDKAVHLVIYFTLTLAYLNAATRGGTRTTARACWIAFVAAALFGASDEWHQAYVPGRSADFDDWIADVVGAGAAVLWTWKVRRKSVQWEQDAA